MRRLVLSLVALAGLALWAAPASAYGSQCGYRWSNHWQQMVYRCVSYERPYYQPHVYPRYYGPYAYPRYHRPYYTPYHGYSPGYQGLRFRLCIGC